MDVKIIVNLSNGARISITDAEVRLVYDELWLQTTDVKVAVSTAGMLEYARRGSRLRPAREIALSEPQSSVFRKALVRIREP